jgi:hypothetical protein
MESGRRRDEPELERALEERKDERTRQSSGSTPTEDVLERAFEYEPGVERHAGEDPGGVTESEP